MSAVPKAPWQGKRPVPLPDNAVDLALTSRFLDLLAEGQRVTFQTFDDDDARKDPSLTRILHGDLEQHGAQLSQLNDAGAGVFVCVNETDGAGRKEANVIAVRAVFLDLDGAPLQPVLDAGLDPHIVVETSPGHYHVYWLVCDCPPQQFKPIQQALAHRFHGDEHVCDLPRVMRLPGSFHRKASPFRTRIVAARHELPYSVAQVVAGLQLDLCAPRKETGEPQHRGDDWITSMLSGADLHANALRVIGRMVKQGLEESVIRGVFNGMRPQLVASRGEARVAALFGTSSTA